MYCNYISMILLIIIMRKYLLVSGAQVNSKTYSKILYFICYSSFSEYKMLNIISLVLFQRVFNLYAAIHCMTQS